MPKNQFQRMIFALLTVLVTVHAYVFYSLYVVNGGALMQANQTTDVLTAIHRQGGVYMPFAFFSQLFFIQPLIRTVFRAIFCRRASGAIPTAELPAEPSRS